MSAVRGDQRAIRILVADDHAIVRGGVVSVLRDQSDIHVVGEAENGAQAVDRFNSLRPDITLMDLRMPVMGGVEVVQAVRAIDRDARLIVLTTYDSDDDIGQALRAGAKAYLLKDVTALELIACVRAVYSGRRWVSPSVAAKLAELSTRVQLTPREMSVLRELATGRSNKEIAAVLTIAEGTVKIHVAHLYAKLSVTTRTEALSVALQRGLIRMPERT